MPLQTHTVSNQGKKKIKKLILLFILLIYFISHLSLTLNNNQQDLIDTPRGG